MDIFISYRRDDSGIAARWLHQELAARWGVDAVFMDIDDVGYGDDFAAVIDASLARADVVLVVVGPRWHGLIEQRLRGDDWVRHEVAQALALRQASGGRRPRVLPVLLDGAPWPGPALPADIAPLQRLNAPRLRQAQLKSDLNELLQAVQGSSFEDIAGEFRAKLLTLGWTGLVAPLAALLVFFAAWLALFDLLTFDTLAAGATVALVRPPAVGGPSEVVLVAIDQATVSAQGQPYGPAWRALHAQVVQRAAAAGARALAFDLFMPTPADPAADRALQQALAAVQGRMPVVLAYDSLDGDKPAIAPALAALTRPGLACVGTRLGRAALVPLAVQPAVALAPAAGSVPGTAAGPAARSAPAAPPRLLQSLALAAYAGNAGATEIDAVDLRVEVPVPPGSPPGRNRAWVDYFSHETVRAVQSGCPALQPGDAVANQWVDPQPWLRGGQGVLRIAYQDVLAGQPAALQALAGRTVLVGVQLPRADQFALAAAGQVVWGSELLAAQIDTLHRGSAIRPLGAVAQWAAMTASALAGAGLALWLRSRPTWLRRLAWAAAAALVVAVSLLWYRVEGQVVAAHHLLVALGCGGGVAAWLARQLRRRAALVPLPVRRTTGATG